VLLRCYAAAASFGRFLLPGGRPRRLRAVIQAGGRPRRLPWPRANRSSVMIASSICSRSWRKSASIFSTSIGLCLPAFRSLFGAAGSEFRTKRQNTFRSQLIEFITILKGFQEICSEIRTEFSDQPHVPQATRAVARGAGRGSAAAKSGGAIAKCLVNSISLPKMRRLRCNRCEDIVA